MHNNIKMVGLDLDGTLLTSEKKVTDYTKNILEKAIAQGCEVLISTGRPLSAVSKEVFRIEGMRYAVTVNGAKIYDLRKGEVIFEKPVPFDLAVQVMEICCSYDSIAELITEDKIYTNQECLEHLEDYYSHPSMIEYVLTTRTGVSDVKEMLMSTKRPIDKLRAVFRYPEERIEARKRLQEIPGIVIANSSTVDLEINVEGADKGAGLLWLGKELGIQREEIMACGDSYNDYEMLKTVGFAVAMENGEDSVKAIADYITDTNDHDGVAKAFEKFVLK